MGPEWWAEAMVTANYTRNRVPSRVHGKTPWEMFYGEKPNLSNLRVFGARAYIHVPKGNRKKMEPVSERGVFLGYEPNSKAYRVLRERDGRVIVSRDVIVDERGPSEIVELGSDPEKEKVEPLDRASPPTQPLDQGVPGIGGDDVDLPEGGDGAAGLPVDVDDDTEEDETLERRYPTRARRAPGGVVPG